jgi:hypothetical protein
MIETELNERFAALADTTNDGSWAEVVGRAAALRRRRHRLPLALAAALTVAVVATPALGLRGKVVRLFDHAQPPPHRIVKAFSGWNTPSLRSGVQADRAVKVLEARVTPDRTAVLWVAPSRVGFCTIMEIGGPAGEPSGCEEVGYDRLGVWVSLQGGVAPDGEILGGPVLIAGSTGLERADSLVLRFQDGDTVSIPLVWVTAPIDTGFFVYGVPERHWQAGHLPTTLTLRDAEGHELDQRPINGITTKGSLSPR